MDTFFGSEMFTSYLTLASRVVLHTAVLLVAVATYRSQFATSPVQAEVQEMGEFKFLNGMLLPHKEYLYGYSEGRHFIIGKKIPGHDYAPWEAEYQSFRRIESVTYANSYAKAIWSWTFENSNPLTNSHLLKQLLWFFFVAVCAFLLAGVGRKIYLSRKKTKKQAHFLAPPSTVLEAEHSKLSSLWRKTLIKMYREQKREVLSLTHLVGYYYGCNRNLEQSLAEEKGKTARAKGEMETMQEEHARQIKQQQSQIDCLNRMLETQTLLAQSSEHSMPAIIGENMFAYQTIKILEEELEDLHVDVEAAEVAAQEHEEQATVNSPVEVVDHDISTPLGGSPSSVEPGLEKQATVEDQEQIEGLTEQDDSSPVPDNQDASPEVGEGEASSMGETSTAEAARIGDGITENTNEQDDQSSAPKDESDGPKLGKNGKPLQPRMNRRKDGTVRTKSHPDYVPPAPRPSAAPAPLGDRPFYGVGRGNGYGEGGDFGHDGGRNRGRGRGGRIGGGRFGWRVGRGGRGDRGTWGAW